MTPEQIDEVIRPHGMALFARDVEKTLATVGPNPLWEFHPVGLAITERDALRSLYQILFDHVLPNIVSTTERCRAYGNNFIIQEQLWRFNFDGHESDAYFTLVMSFDDRYVIGERCYMSGPLVGVFERCFDETFRSSPGVVDLFSLS